MIDYEDQESDSYLTPEEMKYPVEEQQILVALRYLADNDDGCEDKDHAGFSKIDGEFGRDLANKEYPLTAKQLLAAHKICKKYQRTQLTPAGYMLPEDEAVQALARRKEMQWTARQQQYNAPQSYATGSNARVIGLKDGLLGVMFPPASHDFQANLSKIKELQREVEGLRLLNPTMSRVCFVEDNRGDKSFKYWQCPLEFAEQVVKSYPDFKVTPEVMEIVNAEAERKAEEQRKIEEAQRLHRERVEKLLGALGDLDAPIGDRTLYQHQKEAIRTLIEWNGGILAHDPGLGKTSSCSMIAKAYMKAEGCRVVVVGPKTLRANWVREAGWMEVPIEYFTHDSIPTNIPDKFVLIVDECFPAGTMVLTDQGPLPIERIVNEQLPVQIVSCNTEKMQLEYKPIARYIRKPLQGSLVKVTHENGSFVCTPNHKIWTEESGYVTAGTLKSGAHLRTVRKAVFDIAERKDNCTILLKELRSERNKQSARSQGGDVQEIWQTNDYQNMRMVPKDFSDKVRGESQRRATILQRNMLNILEIQSARSQGKDKQAKKGSACYDTGNEIARGIKAYEGKQPYEESRVNGEDAQELIWKDFSSTRRQWQTYRTSDPLGGCIEVAYGASYYHGSGQRHVSLPSSLLQSRYSRSCPQSGNRSGWKDTQTQEMEISRQAQDRDIECSRVVSVEVYERGSDERSRSGDLEDTTVYNLEITDNHNYIADGILVSNCHAYQSRHAKRSKKFLELAWKAEAVICATGTPSKNGRPSNIYPLLLACKHPLVYAELSDGSPAHDQIKKLRLNFEKRYCAAQKTEYSQWDVTGAAFLEELHRKIVDTPRGVLRRRKDQCLDLPAKIRKLVPVELSKAEAESYRNEVSEMWNEYEARVEAKINEFKETKLPGKINQAIGDWLQEVFSKEILASAPDPHELVPAEELAAFKAKVTTLLIEQERTRVESGQALVMLGHFRHAGSKAKARATIDLIDSIFEEDAEEELEAEREGRPHKSAAVIVFCAYKDTAAQIAEKFGVPVMSGDTPDKQRQPMVDAFQAGENRVFVGIYGAGGVGVTLTAANTVILVDRPWTPGEVEQAEDRAHRIGQDGHVLCQWLQVPQHINPVDAKIDAILQKKQENVVKMLDGGVGNYEPDLLFSNMAHDLLFEATHFKASKEVEVGHE